MMSLARACPVPPPSIESTREFLARIRKMNEEEFQAYVKKQEDLHRPKTSDSGRRSKNSDYDDIGAAAVGYSLGMMAFGG